MVKEPVDLQVNNLLSFLLVHRGGNTHAVTLAK